MMRRRVNKIDRTNMFRNPEIIETTFRWASFQTKKNLRLLNKLWRDITLKEWRKTAAIKLQLVLYNHYDNDNDRSDINLEDFKMILDGRGGRKSLEPFRFSEVPFRRFIICLKIRFLRSKHTNMWVDVDSPAYSQSKIFYEFLETHGSSMEYLRINNLMSALRCMYHCCFSCTDWMRWVLVHACPNLKELSVYIYSDVRVDSFNPSEEALKMWEVINNKEIVERLPVVPLEKLTIEMGPHITMGSSTWWYGYSWVQKSVVELTKLFGNVKSLTFRGLEDSDALGFFHNTLSEGGYLKKLEKLELDLKLELHNLRLSCFLLMNSVLQSPLKDLRIKLDIDDSEQAKNNPMHFHSNGYDEFGNIIYEKRDGKPYTYFCLIANQGRTLTHLKLDMEKPKVFHFSETWLSELRNNDDEDYDFEDLTHLKINMIEKPDSTQFRSNKVSFDFRVLGKMRKLKVFLYVDSIQYSVKEEDRQPMLGNSSRTKILRTRGAPQEVKLHPNTTTVTCLPDLKEFFFYLPYHPFNVKSLREVLSCMKGLRVLALELNNDTFPVAFEMLPLLEELILFNQSVNLSSRLEAKKELERKKLQQQALTDDDDGWKIVRKKSTVKRERKQEEEACSVFDCVKIVGVNTSKIHEELGKGKVRIYKVEDDSQNKVKLVELQPKVVLGKKVLYPKPN